MQRLLRWGLVIALLWCAWWALASYGAQRGLQAMFEARAQDGWQAEISQQGFPFRIAARLEDLTLTNPEQQIALQASAVGLSVPTWWPGDLTLDLPRAPMTLQTPVSTLVLQADAAEAGVRLRPGLALELDSLHMLSGAWGLQMAGEELIIGDTLDLRAERDTSQPHRYDLRITAAALTPGARIRAVISLPPDWPAGFERFAADAAVTFDRAIDRHLEEADPPQPRALLIRDIDIMWGPVRLSASGALDIDDQGVPEGQIVTQLANWRSLLDLAERAGVLPGDRRQQAEMFLGLLANRQGSAEDMDLTLDFTNGRMALSGIPLGPAPRLVIE